MHEPTQLTSFERRLSERLEAELSAALRPFDPETVAAGARGGRAVRARRSQIALLAAALLLLTGSIVAVGSGLIRLPWFLQPPLPWPLEGVLEPAGSLVVGAQIPVAVVLHDGRVLVISMDPNENKSAAEIWDPATGRLAPAGAMARLREAPLTVVLPDGRVLLVGDRSGMETTAEVFDPGTATFSLLESTPTTINPSAVVLRDGRVLLAGGSDRIDPVEAGGPTGVASRAEIFDPGTNAFVPIGPMQRPRLWHDLELLRDGRVLILGGLGVDDGQQAEQPFAETFDPVTGAFELAERLPLSTNLFDWHARVDHDRLVFLRQPGWGQYPDRSLPMTVTFYELSTGAQSDGPTIPATAPVHDVRSLIPLTESRLLLAGSDKASFGADDLGVHSKGWLGVLDLESGELRQIAVREASWGTAVGLLDGRVLVVGGSARTECPLPGVTVEPCMDSTTAVDILR